MNRTALAFLAFLLLPALAPAQDVLRGEVRVELEPIPFFSVYVEDRFPLDTEAAYRLALRKAALFFSAQIYGWSFHYDIGERARGIAEEFELTPLGEIHWGDPRLFVTHARFENHVLSAWMDYRPSEIQRHRLQMWRMGRVRSAQATGHGPMGGPEGPSEWLDIKMIALEDAARAAVRAMLQGSERNRPKQATGFISLQAFPSFRMESGQMAARARFRVEVREIIPFAVH
ncbi:MAG: hypothetical protein FWC64_08205 [Treponema sp.]|nr:hypothetical protein [Treponema sp.]